MYPDFAVGKLYTRLAINFSLDMFSVFAVVFSCVQSVGWGQRLPVVCDAKQSKSHDADSPNLSLVRQRLICSEFCPSGNPCKEVPSWLDLDCSDKLQKNLKPHKGGIGRRCSTNETCISYNKDAECFQGTCLCRPGLSLDGNGRCVRVCKRYGTSFTSYEGLCVRGHNTRTLAWGMTLRDCKHRCSQENGFKCKSVEIVNHLLREICHLSNESFLDVPETERVYGDTTCTLSTRNCWGV